MDTTALSPDAQDLVMRLRRGELVAAPRPLVDDLLDPAPDTGRAPGAPVADEARPAGGRRTAWADRLPFALRGALVDPAARGAVLLGFFFSYSLMTSKS